MHTAAYTALLTNQVPVVLPPTDAAAKHGDEETLVSSAQLVFSKKPMELIH